MTHRLYQLIAECEDREVRLSKIILDSNPSMHESFKSSSARTLKFRYHYYSDLQEILWGLLPLLGSFESLDLDTLFASIDGHANDIEFLLTCIGVRRDDILRPRALRKTLEGFLRGDTPDISSRPSPRTKQVAELVDTVLKEFTELIELRITRNDQLMVKHFEMHPNMKTSRALKIERERVLTICNNLGDHNLQLAYEIVGMVLGRREQAIRKTYSRSKGVSKEC